MDQLAGHALDFAWNWASWLLVPVAWWRWHRRRWRPSLRHEAAGVVVLVRRWPHKAEVGRVGHNRPASANPNKDFNEQFGLVMGRARDRCSQLNAADRNVRSK